MACCSSRSAHCGRQYPHRQTRSPVSVAGLEMSAPPSTVPPSTVPVGLTATPSPESTATPSLEITAPGSRGVTGPGSLELTAPGPLDPTVLPSSLATAPALAEQALS